MSTKSTIILSDNNEHWYEETGEGRYVDGKFVGYDIVLEINKDSVVTAELTDDGIFIQLRGDSNLARKLAEIKRLSKYTGKTIIN